jgi:hypothetical protein
MKWQHMLLNVEMVTRLSSKIDKPIDGLCDNYFNYG